MGTPKSRAIAKTIRESRPDQTPVTKPAYDRNLGFGSSELGGAIGVFEDIHSPASEEVGDADMGSFWPLGLVRAAPTRILIVPYFIDRPNIGFYLVEVQ
jgi:hypothetical protein